MKYKLLVAGFILSLFFPARNAMAATPTVTSLTPSNTSIGTFEKFEASFQISKSYPTNSFLPYYYFDSSDTPSRDPNRASPYGIDGITINAHIVSPSGEVIVPAFYYQEFTRGGSATSETMTPSSNYSWKFRYTSSLAGSYRYFVTIEDRDGTTRYEPSSLTFQVHTSDSKGFVRVSPQNPRFFSFDNGAPFIPIGMGHQWWANDGRSFDYEQTLTKFGQNGVNLVRIWDQNDGYALTVEGHFDHYSYPGDFKPTDSAVLTIPKGTQMNQRGNWEEDRIVESAEQNGVYIILGSHGDPYWIWDASVYDEGWNPNPASFSDWRHVNYWKRNMRYRIARWGYSPAILAWETWNEHGHIPINGELFTFYTQLGAYIKETDSYHHLRTTSQGSQAWSPGFWSSSVVDMATYHDYLMPGRYAAGLFDDEVNFVYRFGQCLRTPASGCLLGIGDGSVWTGAAKPIVWAEQDVGTANWDTGNPQPIADHNMLWAGLFSPLGSSGIDWYWNMKTSYQADRYRWAKIASDFFKPVDFSRDNFSYLSSSDVGITSQPLETSNTNMRALALRSATKQTVYILAQNKNYTWGKGNTSPAAISGTITIPGAAAAAYHITYWDTDTGTKTTGSDVIPSGGSLIVPVNNLSRTVAIALSTGTSSSVTAGASPTRIPTIPAVPPNPIIKSGDANGDGVVSTSDVGSIMAGFGGNTNTLDQYQDGVINAMDIAVVLAKLSITTNSTPTPSQAPIIAASGPTPTIGQPSQNTGEWTQFGHDAMRTNATSQSVPTPWRFKWQWNGAGLNGKKQPGHLSVPDLIQPITGGGRVYMVAGNAVYGLNKTTGAVLWTNASLGALSATGAYSNELLYIPSSSGVLYKLRAGDGQVAGQFAADSKLDTAVLLSGTTVYIVSGNGTLYALDSGTLSKRWQYSAGAGAATPPTLSTATARVIFASQDLYVHAVDASTGTRVWRIKPTPRNPGDPGSSASNSFAEFTKSWPVVAEAHGIVFLRVRLDWNSLWTWNPFPNSLAAIRDQLTQSPSQQALFALRLTDGSPAFIPLAGNGGAGDGGTLPMGPLPVIQTQGGHEVAYTIWRSGQTCGGCPTAGACGAQWCDGREDATVGEMVLDTATVQGYQSGDLRFVQFIDIQTDEMMQMTMSGNTLFHNHWLASEAETITDRSPSLGGSFNSPIKTIHAPYTIWRQCDGTNVCNYPNCTSNSTCGISCQATASRYCSSGLYSYGDARSYPAGFYEYNNDISSGSTPYTIVSDGLVIVKTIDGGLMAYESGNPLADGAVKLAAENPADVLGVQTHRIIPYTQAASYVDQTITVEGVIRTVVDHRPKAVYLGFTNPHDGALLIRIFEKDLARFPYNPTSLLDKHVQVTGKITLYWPENLDPEIIVSDPSQIGITEP